MSQERILIFQGSHSKGEQSWEIQDGNPDSLRHTQRSAGAHIPTHMPVKHKGGNYPDGITVKQSRPASPDSSLGANPAAAPASSPTRPTCKPFPGISYPQHHDTPQLMAAANGTKSMSICKHQYLLALASEGITWQHVLMLRTSQSALSVWQRPGCSSD